MFNFFKKNLKKNNNEIKDPSFEIWGTGNPLREFMYVDDLGYAIEFLLDKKVNDNLINVGTGEGTDIQTIADLISDYQTSIPQRPGEALHSRSNTDKIKETLNWNYKIKVIDWITKKFNGAS